MELSNNIFIICSFVFFSWLFLFIVYWKKMSKMKKKFLMDFSSSLWLSIVFFFDAISILGIEYPDKVKWAWLFPIINLILIMSLSILIINKTKKGVYSKTKDNPYFFITTFVSGIAIYFLLRAFIPKVDMNNELGITFGFYACIVLSTIVLFGSLSWLKLYCLKTIDRLNNQ